MLICEKCGRIIDDEDLPTHREYHGFTHHYEVLADGCRCGGDFVEAKKCEICGEWSPSDEGCSICDYCLAQEENLQTSLEFGDLNRESVQINGFIAYTLTADQINHILEKWVKENLKDDHTDIKLYLEDDKSAFSDFIENRNREKK